MDRPPWDATWPNIGERTLVRAKLGGDFEALAKAVEEHPEKLFFVTVCNNLRDFKSRTPERWWCLPPDGLPPNLWLGVSWLRKEDLAEVAYLRKCRASRLFVLAEGKSKPFPRSVFDNWRCSNCGRRGEGDVPDTCPTGSICLDSEFQPQIHWLIDATNSLEDFARAKGMHYWSGIGPQEIPDLVGAA